MIAFVGSVFSPYYAWARRRAATDPENHCALNVALYGKRGSRWSMTERGAGQLVREESVLCIGPSTLCWTGGLMQIAVDEICAPVPRRLRGSIRIIPTTLCDRSFVLDAWGFHRWSPIAPCARIEVNLSDPSLSWCGSGYMDSNYGVEPLENAFEAWSWSRASRGDRTLVLYDTMARNGEARSLALDFDSQGGVHEREAPPRATLPPTRWRLPRHTRAEPGQDVHLVSTLEDGPFYSRSLLRTSFRGSAATATAIHESLSLDRFRAAWVRCLLPFRMPRIAR